MPRFQSIISRVVVLHVVAVVITSIVISVALSWLLSYATDNIHNKAMQEQADSVGRHLSVASDGHLKLKLPSSLLGIYSPDYGRYSYAVVDGSGHVLFSSLSDHGAIFPTDARASGVEFLQHDRGGATIAGASVRKDIGGHTVWIQTGEDLANRDAITDDIAAAFYKNVGWITLPILLALLAFDIAVFRRALWPLRQASEIAAGSDRRGRGSGCRPMGFRARFARWSPQSIWGSTGSRRAFASSATSPRTQPMSCALP